MNYGPKWPEAKQMQNRSEGRGLKREKLLQPESGLTEAGKVSKVLKVLM